MKIEIKFYKYYTSVTMFTKPVIYNIVETFYFLNDPDEMDRYIDLGFLFFNGHFLSIYKHKTFGSICGINTRYRKERFCEN